MQRLLQAAMLLALYWLIPAPFEAQVATGPGITLTAAQRAQSDSIVKFFGAADARLIAAGDSAVQGRLSTARRALRMRLHEAIRGILTPAQLITYDAWYAAAAAAFEARRPSPRTRPPTH